jgi:predicted dehydrogenase
VEFAGILDARSDVANQLAREHNTQALSSMEELAASADGAVVATPTTTHEDIAAELLKRGVHVLVEKPIAVNSQAGERLDRLASEQARILQVGHLERFNPAVQALRRCLTVPLFFEVHRLSAFTLRSLDVDVVLDLMIHDLDIVLTCTGEWPSEIRAAGISVLSTYVDIANVRLAFPSGCVANLTASRISTEKVRKLRLFQPGEYISIDYTRQDAVRLAVGEANQIGGGPLPVLKEEPLRLELEAFVASIRGNAAPEVTAKQAVAALRLAEDIVVKIKEHAETVRETLHKAASRA